MSPPEHRRSVTRSIGRHARASTTRWVLAGALTSGLGAYAFQVLGTRGLGEEAFAPIGVLWTIQYLVLAVPLVAVEAYVTRTVADEGGLRRARGPLAAWVLGVSAGLGALTWVLRDRLYGGLDDLSIVAGLIALSYGAWVVARGSLAGRGRFRAYGLVTGGESLVRVALAIAVLAVVAETRALAWIMPLGPLLAALWWLTRRGDPARPDEASPAVAAVPSTGTGRFLASTTLANTAAQTLLAGGPLILIPLGASAAEFSVFFVTITAARAPMVFAIGGVLSRVLPPLTRLADRRDEAGIRQVTGLLAVGSLVAAAMGAGAAALLGPELIGLLFGQAFAPPRAFVTVAAAGVLLATGSIVLNQVLIGARAEQRLPAPWLTGLCVAAVVIAVLDTSATMRVAWGFLAGEATALAGLVVAVRRVLTLRAAAEHLQSG